MCDKVEEFKNIFKDIQGYHSNDWKSKEREQHFLNKLIELKWMNDGNHLKDDKDFIALLKDLYFSYSHETFNTLDMVHDYYVIHEPFGGNSSPDFLFLTPNGIFSVEDKGSGNGTIYWNTGTPSHDKIISFYDQKEEKVYLISSTEYGWTQEVQEEWLEWVREKKEQLKAEFATKFHKYSDMMSNMDYYLRNHLEDKNKVVEFYDENENDVNKILYRYLMNNHYISKEIKKITPTPTVQLTLDFSI